MDPAIVAKAFVAKAFVATAADDLVLDGLVLDDAPLLRKRTAVVELTQTVCLHLL